MTTWLKRFRSFDWMRTGTAGEWESEARRRFGL